MKPRLLDLFCGQGGAAMGYHRAGFEVVGVDIRPQPRYPFEFHQSDALDFPLDGFNVIHASPPCQGYSITRHATKREYPMLIEPVRAALVASGRPYVIENVVGAPLLDPITLCGTMFAAQARDTDGTLLYLKRHRLFESNVPLTTPGPCMCRENDKSGIVCAGVYGGGSSRRSTMERRGGYTPSVTVRRHLIGASWMCIKGLSQSIPPSYTEWIGTQLLRSSI